MLDDLTIGVELDMTPFVADMAVVDAAVSTPPTMDLTPIANQFNAVTGAVQETVVATRSLDGSEAIRGLESIQTGLSEVSSMATTANFNVTGFSRALTAVSIASKPLASIPGSLGVISSTTSLAAHGAAQLSAGFALVSTMATYMAHGIGIVLMPLRGLIIIPKLVGAAFSAMFAIILAPLKMLAFGLKTLVKAAWMVAKPILAISAAVLKLRMFFASLHIQLKLLGKFFALLPPKLKIVVGG